MKILLVQTNGMMLNYFNFLPYRLMNGKRGFRVLMPPSLTPPRCLGEKKWLTVERNVPTSQTWAEIKLLPEWKFKRERREFRERAIRKDAATLVRKTDDRNHRLISALTTVLSIHLNKDVPLIFPVCYQLTGMAALTKPCVLFLSAAIGQRSRNYSRCCCCSCSFPFVSFPL